MCLQVAALKNHITHLLHFVISSKYYPLWAYCAYTLYTASIKNDRILWSLYIASIAYCEHRTLQALHIASIADEHGRCWLSLAAAALAASAAYLILSVFTSTYTHLPATFHHWNTDYCWIYLTPVYFNYPVSKVSAK